MATTRTGVNGLTAMLNVAMDLRLDGDHVQILWLLAEARNAQSMGPTQSLKFASRNLVKVRNTDRLRWRIE